MQIESQVSIILLCYNTGQRILATLDSIKAQTYKNWELIIIDDHSSDDSISLIKHWLDDNQIAARLITNEKNLGIGKSLNKGLEICSGKFLTIIGDDEWLPNYLNDFTEILSNAPGNVALVTGKADVIDKSDQDKKVDVLDARDNIQELDYPYYNKLFYPIAPETFLFSKDIFFDVLFWANPVVAFCTMIRIDALRSVGGYSEDYLMEDFPTWFKLSCNYDMIYVDKVFGNYNRYTTNISTEKGHIIYEEVLKIRLQYLKKIRMRHTKLKWYNEQIDRLMLEKKRVGRWSSFLGSLELRKLYWKKIFLRLGLQG